MRACDASNLAQGFNFVPVTEAPTMPPSTSAAPSTSTPSTTSTTTVPPAHSDGRWVLGNAGQSCDTGCAQQGLACDQTAFHRHVYAIDSHEDMASLMTSLGATCNSFNDNYGSNPDVPVTMFASNLCFAADPARGVETMNCGLAVPMDRKRVCWCSNVGTSPPSTTVTTTVVSTTTVSSTTAGFGPTPAPSPASGGWSLAPAGASCSAGCTARGLRCDAADFHSHSSEVDSESKMSAVVQGLGQSCSQFNTNWGSAGDVPILLVDNGLCFPSAAGRVLSSISCDAGATVDKRRLCWCSGEEPAPTTTATVGPTTTVAPPSTTTTLPGPQAPAVGGWHLAGWGQSCSDGCASHGLVCDAQQFHGHNSEVDSTTEMNSVVQALGGQCNWYLDNWGDAGDVPVTMASNNALCFPSGPTRSLASINCGATTASDKQRLCYCVQASALLQSRQPLKAAAHHYGADAEVGAVRPIAK